MRRSQLELALDHAQSSLAAALGGLPVGWLRLETWAPGDGWTRYRLIMGNYESAYMRRRAMMDALDTISKLGSALCFGLIPQRRAQAETRQEVDS